MKPHQFGIDVINRHNSESCTIRLTVRNDDGTISDILEGPSRYVIEQLLFRISPESKLRLRKVRK